MKRSASLFCEAAAEATLVEEAAEVGGEADAAALALYFSLAGSQFIAPIAAASQPPYYSAIRLLVRHFQAFVFVKISATYKRKTCRMNGRTQKYSKLQ